MIKVFTGQQSVRSFRLKKIQEGLSNLSKQLDLNFIRDVFLIETSRALSDLEFNQLSHILETQLLSFKSDDHQLNLVPRPGSISPWSSKATEIVNLCGLDAIIRIEKGRQLVFHSSLKQAELASIFPVVADRMVEAILDETQLERWFSHAPAKAGKMFDLENNGQDLYEANQSLGLALSNDEIEYLIDAYQAIGKNPTDAELMMFAQANSEHCRHKIFNAEWTVDNEKMPSSLFGMIRVTHQKQAKGTLSAYSDNAAVIQGQEADRFWINPTTRAYQRVQERADIQIKVETHNHPTAISPFPGAATGSGGEIRDEAATGRGAKTKAGLTGFSVSNLHIPGHERAWEIQEGKPDRIRSALDIMLEAPIGAAAFNNEFGRPALCGYFRSYGQIHDGVIRAYHKPIMLAGGYGNIRPDQVEKGILSAGDAIIVLGGPAMLIGLGGGAASSMDSGASCSDLDYASVQRDNPEMQRRCQEVIDRCWAMGSENPIKSIHDVGAGGLSNAIPELLHDSGLGGLLQLRDIPMAESGLSPMQCWSNEAQERYVLGVSPENLDHFMALCQRERCPVAMVGLGDEQGHLKLNDKLLGEPAVDIPMDLLFGNAPRMHRQVKRKKISLDEWSVDRLDNTNDLINHAENILRHPSVASKAFLITIGDRSITGQVARDQMVGPWQVPVSDVAVTANDYSGYFGEAMAIGERSVLALTDPAASGRMVIAETLTNLAAARIESLENIKLSANWMAACGSEGEDAALYDTVQAVAMEFCPDIGLSIPVGKDSLSMQTHWLTDGENQKVVSPLSLLVTGFAPVLDVRKTLTPELRKLDEDSVLVLVDLGAGQDRLGGSIAAEVNQKTGIATPDIDRASILKNFFNWVQYENSQERLLAYHDRSDGGLWACLCEMAFASHCGLEIGLSDSRSAFKQLFAEESGAVIQVRSQDLDDLMKSAQSYELNHLISVVAKPVFSSSVIEVVQNENVLYRYELQKLLSCWNETSYLMRALRDHPDCAQSEYQLDCDLDHPGLNVKNRSFAVEWPQFIQTSQPKVGILREQGVNGHIEMAAAFDTAGFECVDIHMSDLIESGGQLKDVQGLVACGGFSYGDVLGAGRGWASSIRFHDHARSVFQDFFEDKNRFVLGVCNGCQMLSQLSDLIPGTDHWPKFRKNQSEQFEARLSLVEVQKNQSIFLNSMEGLVLPVAVAHGEGRAEFSESSIDSSSVVLKYVDGFGQVTEQYPLNPNGSPNGITGLTNEDGRITIMMPHPERVFRSIQLSWLPEEWGAYTPWMQMFINARKWVS